MKADIRFWDKVAINKNGCWNWLASCYKNGYGKFYLNGKSIKAHVFAFVYAKGPVPKGLEIDHLCRNRKCVNPDHMELVTRSENIRRGLLPEIGRQYQKSKTHCPKGHPYDLLNTYIRPDGGRDCRTCQSMRNHKWRMENVKS